MPFRLLDLTAATTPEARRHRRGLLSRREVPAALGDLRAAAPRYQPSPALAAAVNSALAVGAPLLITGEPGTGKTQVAHYLAWYFDVEEWLYRLDVRSTTTAADLLYTFDSVAYFHAAHDPARKGEALRREGFVRKGPLWLAMESGQPAIVLIDEIDKAPRDFPNDLLGVLGEGRFCVTETGQWVERRAEAPRPLLVITSNSERRLPEPFLRRCVFHHIELTDELLRKAVAARRADHQGLSDGLIDAALGRLWELRRRGLRKRPGTAEMLVWLALLSAQGGVEGEVLARAPLGELPGLEALVKDSDDLKALRGDG